MEAPLQVNVFIDALGWKIQEARPFLADVLRHRRPLDTVFGYSSTCDPTILTGRWPREHGHFAFYRYDPAGSPFSPGLCRALSLLPRGLASRGRVRARISRWLARHLGFSGYFQLYAVPFERLPSLDYSERRDLYQPGGIRGGQPTLLDRLRDAGVPLHVSDWRADDRTNVGAACSALGRGDLRFCYVYLAGLDALLHRHGTQAAEPARYLTWLEHALRRLLDVARMADPRAVLRVFSDHGMTDVTTHCDLQARIRATGLRWGRDYAAVYDSTMARFWFLREGVRSRIEQALSDESRGRILSSADLASFGCDFPDAAYGETFFLLDPGVLMLPSDLGTQPMRGMHGYAPGHEDSTAFYGCSDSEPHAPTSLVDLHDVLLAPFGLGREARKTA
jgi:hypothetical protein